MYAMTQQERAQTARFLVKMASFWLHEEPCLKVIEWRVIKRYSIFFTGFCRQCISMHATHTHACVHAKEETNKRLK